MSPASLVLSFDPLRSPSAGKLFNSCTSTSFVSWVHPYFIVITLSHPIAPHLAKATSHLATRLLLLSSPPSLPPPPQQPSPRHHHNWSSHCPPHRQSDLSSCHRCCYRHPHHHRHRHHHCHCHRHCSHHQGDILRQTQPTGQRKGQRNRNARGSGGMGMLSSTLQKGSGVDCHSLFGSSQMTSDRQQ